MCPIHSPCWYECFASFDCIPNVRDLRITRGQLNKRLTVVRLCAMLNASLYHARAAGLTTTDITATQAETNAGVARATGVLALGNIASRMLGLAREVVLTNLFGASHAVDAFLVATIVPKTLYDLLIAGHVNSAIIPVLSEVVTREGQKALWQLVSVLISLVTALLAALVLILTLFAPQIVAVVGSGLDASTQAMTASLLRLTAPALLFLGLFSVLSGTLYALRSFTLPAFAGVVFNGCIAVMTVLLAPAEQVMTSFNGVHVEWTAGRPAWGVQAAALGWLVGAFVQLAIQLPGLKGLRLRLTFHWRHPAVRQIVRLYIPVLFSLVIDTLVVRLFSYNLATNSGIVGSTGIMNWATTLIQFPQGLVATAISIAILPTLARQAIQMSQPPDEAGIKGQLTTSSQPFRDTLGLGLRLTITLILPATIGLFVLAQPIIRLLFQHGAFTPYATSLTTMALRLYLIGLPFAAVDLLLVYAFYARQDTLTPALIGLLSLVVYMLVAITLLPSYGLFSLMIADSVKHIVHTLVSAYLLGRRMGGYGEQHIFLTMAKTGLAALTMGVVAVAVEPALMQRFSGQSFLQEAALVGLSAGLSLLVFLVMAALLRIEELRWLGRLLFERLHIR
jgi:putative peptidoglycan lipid II flippase